MKRVERLPVIVAILAGGLSTRMGRDKARLRLGRRTLLGHIRHTARELAVPVRVIRRDLVPRCGPLGGVLTGLTRAGARTEAVLFLACDMPLVTAEWMRRLLAAAGPRRRAVFTAGEGRAGFPFILPVTAVAVVEKQIAERRFSLQALARAVRAKRLRPPRRLRAALANLNTPAEWRAAHLSFSQSRSDDPMVAVGFNPRITRAGGSRRVSDA